MMKNKKIAALLGVLLAGSMAFSLSACGSTNNASDNKSSGSSSQSSDKKDNSSSSSGAGFEEVPVGPSGTAEEQDKDAGPLTVGAVYFQPIDMEPASMGLKAADSSFHLEADIHANQKGTELGYGKGRLRPRADRELHDHRQVHRQGSRRRQGHLRYLHADERLRRPALRRQRQARQGRHLPAEAVDRIPRPRRAGCCTSIPRPASRVASGPSRSRSPSTTGNTPRVSGD